MRENESAMERLCRELKECVASYASATLWCQGHGISTFDTTAEQDRAAARADIERRIEQAAEEDEAAEQKLLSILRSALLAAGDERDALRTELDALREAGRVLPEGMEWPRWEDGEPVRLGDEVCGRDVCSVRMHGVGWALSDKLGTRFAFASYGGGTLLKRPEPPDSWERLEADAEKDHESYWGCIGFVCAGCPASADGKTPRERYGSRSCTEAIRRDLVRRARALAGAE